MAILEKVCEETNDFLMPEGWCCIVSLDFGSHRGLSMLVQRKRLWNKNKQFTAGAFVRRGLETFGGLNHDLKLIVPMTRFIYDFHDSSFVSL